MTSKQSGLLGTALPLVNPTAIFAPSEVLPTVINAVAPLAPVVVDLPNNAVVQPIAEFLQSINPAPFPSNDAAATKFAPTNIPLAPVNGLLPFDDLAAKMTNAGPLVTTATGAVGAVTFTLDSLNAPLKGAIGSAVAPFVSKAEGFNFPVTPQAFTDEFYNQLQLLHEFFTMIGIKYWLTGGSLLGQYREKRFLRWGDSNAIGIDAVDGPIIFEKLRYFLKMKMPAYDVWNSIHGLKLINKKMKGVATDIYFYALKDKMFVLASDASRKQWPKDMFVAEDLYTLQSVPMDKLMVMAPQNAQSYLFSQYGPKCLKVARLNSFDHFANAGRPFKIVEVALTDILIN